MEGMETFCHHAEKNKMGGGRDRVMEYSQTALPTCYRILYYYGDFSRAPSFAQTVSEREEKDRAEGEKVNSGQEGETV